MTLDFSEAKEDKQLSANLKGDYHKQSFRLTKCTNLVLVGIANLGVAKDLIRAFVKLESLVIKEPQAIHFNAMDLSALTDLRTLEIEEQESASILTRLIPDSFLINLSSSNVTLEMNFLYSKFDLVNLLHFVALNPELK